VSATAPAATSSRTDTRTRVYLLLAGIGILIGGPMHPNGTMVQMLADPAWLPGHALIDASFVLLLLALLRIRVTIDLPPATRRWIMPAIVGTALQVIEMTMHAAAYVDRNHLAAGEPTPVLSTHLAMTIPIYPIFGVTLLLFLIAAQRDKVLGSPWIGWIGVLGIIGHALSAPLVVGLNIAAAGLLFPMLALLGVWEVLAAAIPRRA
jgi:hypothetical protein